MNLSRIPHLKPPPPPDEPSFHDVDFVRASEWLAQTPAYPRAIVVGAPTALGSISRARCDLAPGAIRRALNRFSVWSSDRAVSLERMPVVDAGDVEQDEHVAKTQERIATVIQALLDEALVPVALLGGDNSVTVGGARGAGADALITFDAHHDCRDPIPEPTNGSPVRQLVEGGLARVVQIGIHGFANAEPHARWAMEHRVHWISASRVREESITRTVGGALHMLRGARRVWVDFDLDVLDRAFAPGASASMPGGLTPADLEEAAFVLGKSPRVVGIDICEVDPERDVAETTVRTAAAVLLSYLAGVASR